jgi:uncharacterized protein
MSIFVDSSALFVILDADDLNYPRAKELWSRLLADEEALVSTNYVLVETFALVQRRLGMEALQTLHQEVVPVLSILWIDASLHALASDRLLAAFNRQISLVDWISFGAMQRLRIKMAFAFDHDFRTQGFEIVPSEAEQPKSPEEN